ncbi:MAG: sigma-70 family RNA polymerase sigma factor [Vicinamibacterales bacterium]
MSEPGRVSQLLRAWGDGDAAALDDLLPLVEHELRRRARYYMAQERRGHTLQVTALVNETFIRLTGAQHVRWQDRTHFFSMAARLMRRVLVDHARARGYQKRGGAAERVPLDEEMVLASAPDVDVIALDRALEGLEKIDPRKCQVVDMRYFAGMTNDEIAGAFGVSTDTVKRDWRMAKLWLLKALKEAAPA